jgi:TonB family protein
MQTSRILRSARRAFWGFCVALLFTLSPCLRGQDQPNPEIRKLVYKVAPKYPVELKRNGIGGVVKLSVTINTRGSIGKISTLGGNPALVDAATMAVRQWKYVPADHATTTEVQLDFIPK